VSRTYALSIEQFYALADPVMKEEIKSQSLGCELLIGHADEAEATIVYIDRTGSPHLIETYQAIGSGWTIARAILCQWQWPSEINALEAGARLLSAKKAAEKDPFVGGQTQQVFVTPDGLRVASEDGRKALQDHCFMFPAAALIPPDMNHFLHYKETWSHRKAD
jgi:20S proteasome alpha/beta subunit